MTNANCLKMFMKLGMEKKPDSVKEMNEIINKWRKKKLILSVLTKFVKKEINKRLKKSEKEKE